MRGAPIRYRAMRPQQRPSAMPSPFDMGAVMQALGELRAMHEKFLEMAGPLEERIKSIKQGPPGAPGYSVDFMQVVEEVLRRMPPPAAIEGDRMEQLASLVVKKMPRPKALRGKPGRDGRGVLPEQVLEMLKTRKFGPEHVEGLEQTLSVMRNFMAHGGVRGGGDTVVAGSGITITNTANGNKQIAATGSTGTAVFGEEVSGSGTAWTLAHTPSSGTLRLYANGQRLKVGDDYSIVGDAITTVLSWDAQALLADYNYA